MKSAMAKCGGVSDAKAANEEIQGMCDKVKLRIHEELGSVPPELVAVSYSTQVVAGTNYFVKIKVGGEQYIHARIFQPLPHTGLEAELHSIQKDKKLEDPIEHF